MKTKVKANWLDPEGPREEYNSLQQLLGANTFVGFIPRNDVRRYMFIVDGSTICHGLAVRPTGFWDSIEGQKTTKGDYYIFSTAAELFDWMKG